MQKYWILSFLLVSNLLMAQETIKIKPGQVIKLSLAKGESFAPQTAFCGKDELFFEKTTEKTFFFFATSYFSNPGVKINCGFRDQAKLEKNIAQLEIIDGAFPEEKLSVDPSKVHFSKKALKQIAHDRIILNKLYNHPHGSALFTEPFLPPMDSVLTSDYGGRRLFNGHKASQHLGVDFRAVVGSPVKSANSGKVVLSEYLFFTGKTIIIDHGLGIFSMYGHLSKLHVHKGNMVDRGAVIASSGATGRVSGPHLHWGIKINHNWVHPISLVEASAP
ncbi:MAG: M23 family metallopeptidase [Bacteriovoracaceae bacterium]